VDGQGAGTVMNPIKPFENESDSLAVSNLTIENRTDRIEIYGTLHVMRDKSGLANARTLKSVIDEIVKALEEDSALPDQVSPPKPTKIIKNPFG
jgi:hypothetical protein